MSKPPVVLSFPPSIPHRVFARRSVHRVTGDHPRPVQHHFVVYGLRHFGLVRKRKLDSDNTKEPVDLRLPPIHQCLRTMNSPQELWLLRLPIWVYFRPREGSSCVSAICAGDSHAAHRRIASGAIGGPVDLSVLDWSTHLSILVIRAICLFRRCCSLRHP